MEMQEELSELLQTKVDLVSSNGLSKFIKPIIEKEKKLIYENEGLSKSSNLVTLSLSKCS